MPTFIALIIFVLTICIHILIPQANIISLVAFHQLNSRNDFTVHALYVLLATFIIDTINSVSLGTFAFSWLLIIGPVYIIGFIIKQVSHPNIAIFEFTSYIIYLSIAALAHSFIASLLSGVPSYPTLNQGMFTCIAAIILVMLTKRQIS